MRKFIHPATLAALVFLSQACAKNLDSQGSVPLKNLGNGTCQQASGLMWQVEVSEKFGSWEAARAYAEKLELAGFDDWRLPSKDELYSLCNLFDMQQMGDCQMKFKNSYWSGDQPKHGEVGYWDAYPMCGGTDFRYIKTREGVVRAVRP